MYKVTIATTFCEESEEAVSSFFCNEGIGLAERLFPVIAPGLWLRQIGPLSRDLRVRKPQGFAPVEAASCSAVSAGIPKGSGPDTGAVGFGSLDPKASLTASLRLECLPGLPVFEKPCKGFWSRGRTCDRRINSAML